MRGTFCILLSSLLFLVSGVTQGAAEKPAVETLHVRAQASVALLSTPAADAPIVKRLVPGDAVTVIARQAGFVNVALADGMEGWLRETDLTAIPSPAARVAQLERELDDLRRQLSVAQGTLRTTQGQLRQAQQAANAARTAGAGEAADLEAENQRLQASLAASHAEMEAARLRVSQLEMAQDAARLLAASQPIAGRRELARFTPLELAAAAAGGFLLILAGVWLGASNARRRLRRRYHGLEL